MTTKEERRRKGEVAKERVEGRRKKERREGGEGKKELIRKR